MKCPICGAAELVPDTRIVDGVPAVTADFCPACAEGIPTREEDGHHAAAIRLAELGGQASDMANIPRRRVE